VRRKVYVGAEDTVRREGREENAGTGND